MNKKLFSLCGLECTDCPCFLAYKNNNQELREKTAKKWSKAFGWNLKLEDINCVGYLEVEGPHFIHCEGHCEVRKCGLKKGVVNCGGCPEYDSCAKIASLHKMIHEGKAYCDKIRAAR